MNFNEPPKLGGRLPASGRAVIHSQHTGPHVLAMSSADSFWTRFLGLMFKASLPEGSGLLLKRCSSIHTAFMRFPIDVLYLDGRGEVLKCVSHLKPWRASGGGVSLLAALRLKDVHVLELPAGSIERMGLSVGDTLAQHGEPAVLGSVERRKATSVAPNGQRGAAVIEFALIGPMITLLGMASIQYGMLFNAKNLVNHAAFMAARAGSLGHADLAKIRTAYTTALIPMYGGGKDATQRAEALKKAVDDTTLALKIELLNPTRESFADWNDPGLQAIYKTKQRVIPNANLAYKLGNGTVAAGLGSNKAYKSFNGEMVKTSSGQSLADANLIKIRITHGYEPKVPLMGLIFSKFLQWSDPQTDPFYSGLVAAGRIPVISFVTVQMQSDAIESSNSVSMPGEGNHGKPSNPGEPLPPSEPEPRCASAACTVEPSPNPPSSPIPHDEGGKCVWTETMPTDPLFDFDKSTLNDAGKKELDKWIEEAKNLDFESVTLVGYTDQQGSDAYNQKLSLARAKAVQDYFKSHGFPDKPITVEGRGSRDPIVPLSSCSGKSGVALNECLAPNRRVEVKFVAEKK